MLAMIERKNEVNTSNWFTSSLVAWVSVRQRHNYIIMHITNPHPDFSATLFSAEAFRTLPGSS